MKMVKDNCEVTERILNLTLEIIYLLTGEDYTAAKKTSGECATPNVCPQISEQWRRTSDRITEPSPPSMRPNTRKILELTNEMMCLLSGEVPIRCQDVTVYFSMEEWEYLEGHKDLYKEVMMDDPQTPTSPGNCDGFYKPSGVHGPESTPKSNRVKKLNDEVSRPKQTRTAGVTQRQMGNLKEADAPSPHTPTEQVWQDPSPHVKKEPVPYDGENPKMSTATDLTPQYSYLQIKEEPVSWDEGNFTNGDVNKNVTTPPNKRLFVPTKKDDPTEVVARSHHTVKGKVKMGQLGRNLENTAPLTKKPGSNGEQKSKTFTCLKCNKNFPNKQLFTLHQKIHIREKPFLCPKCGKTFSKISHYIRHQSIHVGVKPYTCPECGKSFSDRSYLTKHQRMHAHLISKPFKCPECEVRFVNQYELVAHCKIHSGKKPFECAECGKRFTRNYQLLKHEKVHTGDVPFLCSECGTCFRNNALLVKHQQYHSKEKQFSCSECGKSFSDRSHYVRHLRIHTGEQPFMCSECGRRFNDKSSLSRHYRLHTGEKPYACSDCGQSYRYSSSLLKHQEVHRFSKPFKCPQCETYFMSNSELLIHCSLHSAGN